MTNITEHHTEQERKCDNAEICWVDLPIPRNAIGINNLLEWHCELVLLEFSRWIDGVVFYFVELRCLQLIGFFPA